MSAGHPIDKGDSVERVHARPQPRWGNGTLRPRRRRPLPSHGALTAADALPVGGASVFVKRASDIVLSVLALLVTAPLMALLSMVIRLDSKGPILYRQIRIGRNGVPFELYKLRTMFVEPGDHATRVGRFLRPMGLDEIPQFWNVLRGQMSIVGPRPERPHLVDEYVRKYPRYASRHLIRPGITGLAQIHGHRGKGSIAERLKRDLEYVYTWTPVGDLWILALSVVAVCRDTRRELRQ